jgi:heat shock protein HslJ
MAKGTPLVVVAFALIAGCGNDESGATAGVSERPPASDLPRASFVALALSHDGEPRSIVPDTEIVITFEDEGQIGWDSGCNEGFSDLAIDEHRLKVDDRFGTTLVGCPGALNGQENWLIAFLTSDPEWRLNEQRLTLQSGSRKMELALKSGT